MILIDKPKLRFLLAGREITVTIPKRAREFRRGHDYAIGIHNGNTICRARITHIAKSQTGIKLTLTLGEQQARFLGRKGGYVTEPAMGLKDEPEAVDRASQERITKLGTLRWQHDRDVARAGVPLVQRIMDLESRAAGGDDQAQRALFVIRQKLGQAEAHRSREAA